MLEYIYRVGIHIQNLCVLDHDEFICHKLHLNPFFISYPNYYSFGLVCFEKHTPLKPYPYSTMNYFLVFFLLFSILSLQLTASKPAYLLTPAAPRDLSPFYEH